MTCVMLYRVNGNESTVHFENTNVRNDLRLLINGFQLCPAHHVVDTVCLCMHVAIANKPSCSSLYYFQLSVWFSFVNTSGNERLRNGNVDKNVNPSISL